MKRLRVAVLCMWALAAATIGSATAPAHASAASSAGKSPSPQAATTSSTSASKKKKAAKKRPKREPSQKAPTADRISEIQSALAHGGYYQGDPNGKWDTNTVAALQKFQSAHGIEASGKLDAPTLQKLGLGSDIAGVSAPRPVPPPSSQAPASRPPSATLPSGSQLIR